ncbi:MAG: STAS domain-containing protein [Zoogloeaceae bacterium]|nr:STAS domain-containing protein [Zoogloeaceae bacterium]
MIDDGQILYARHGDDWVLRVEGPLRYTNANSMDRFIDRLFKGEPPSSVCVDLNDATAIDSTGIGLLAKIARGLARAEGSRPIVFSVNPEINEMLTSVCLDDVCCIVPAAAEGPVAADPIPVAQVEEKALARTIAEAHRLLCELSEDNRAQFQQVVAAFDREAGTPP